jgi:hypothetical protein
LKAKGKREPKSLQIAYNHLPTDGLHWGEEPDAYLGHPDDGTHYLIPAGEGGH